MKMDFLQVVQRLIAARAAHAALAEEGEILFARGRPHPPLAAETRHWHAAMPRANAELGAARAAFYEFVSGAPEPRVFLAGEFSCQVEGNTRQDAGCWVIRDEGVPIVVLQVGGW